MNNNFDSTFITWGISDKDVVILFSSNPTLSQYTSLVKTIQIIDNNPERLHVECILTNYYVDDYEYCVKCSRVVLTYYEFVELVKSSVCYVTDTVQQAVLHRHMLDLKLNVNNIAEYVAVFKTDKQLTVD